MGQLALYRCLKCQSTFEANEGGGFFFSEFRCVDCDAIKAVKCNRAVSSQEYVPPSKEQIGVCEKCGGELKEDLRPMCPQCRSRKVVVENTLVLYD